MEPIFESGRFADTFAKRKLTPFFTRTDTTLDFSLPRCGFRDLSSSSQLANLYGCQPPIVDAPTHISPFKHPFASNRVQATTRSPQNEPLQDQEEGQGRCGRRSYKP
jgi:hypothetical protein